MNWRSVVRGLFLLGAGVAGFAWAAAAGLGGFLLVNAIPVWLWGQNVLAASPYFTIPIGILVAIGVVWLVWAPIRHWLEGAWPGDQSAPRIAHATFFLVTAGLLAGGWLYALQPRSVTLAWQEQIVSDDGATSVVARRQSYRYEGFQAQEVTARQIDTNELRFRPQGRPEVVVRTTLLPVYLGTVGDRWYIVLGPRPRGYAPQPVAGIETAEWGRSFNAQAQRLAVLQDGRFVPLPWSEAPAGIIAANLLTPEAATYEQLRALKDAPAGMDLKRKLVAHYLAELRMLGQLEIGRRVGATQPARAAVVAALTAAPTR